MNTRPSKSKRTDTLVPYTTLVRSLRLGRRLIDLRKSGVEVARLLKLLRFGERRLHRPAQLQRLLLLRFLRGGRRRDDGGPAGRAHCERQTKGQSRTLPPSLLLPISRAEPVHSGRLKPYLKRPRLTSLH